MVYCNYVGTRGEGNGITCVCVCYTNVQLWCQYEIIVAGLVGEERAFVQVSVRVKDVNDLAPSFPRPVLETQITEEDDSHLPKLILQVSLRQC